MKYLIHLAHQLWKYMYTNNTMIYRALKYKCKTKDKFYIEKSIVLKPVC